MLASRCSLSLSLNRTNAFLFLSWLMITRFVLEADHAMLDYSCHYSNREVEVQGRRMSTMSHTTMHTQTPSSAKTSQRKRNPMRQRLATRCSASCAITSRSKVWCSQDGSVVCFSGISVAGVGDVFSEVMFKIPKALSCAQYASAPRHRLLKG